MKVLKLGDVSKAVGDLHQRLVEAGEVIDLTELRSAFFGKTTRLAVLDFQSSHLDVKGHPLQQDGIVGPVTWTALGNPRAPIERFIQDGWRGEITEAPAFARPAVEAAIGEIGVQENGDTNRGLRVDLYNGPNWIGAPWCANFCSWCWSHVDGGSPFGQKASALKLRDWGAQSGKLIAKTELLVPGDIGIILRAGGRGHVEIVTAPEISTEERISLVGGNVAGAVRGTVRPKSQFSTFVRPY